ncbi:hypothetical protein I3W98_06795 [Streptomyces cavourensis]|nr:hypothetical protein [Streptomyces cavourensis]
MLRTSSDSCPWVIAARSSARATVCPTASQSSSTDAAAVATSSPWLNTRLVRR